MEEHGRIIAVLQPRTGVSPRTGEQWVSQEFVLEVDGRYTRRVKFSIFGNDFLQRANLQIGEFVTMKGEVEAHEYQGNWYNELRAYDIIKGGASVRQVQQQAQVTQNSVAAPVAYSNQPSAQYQPYPGCPSGVPYGGVPVNYPPIQQ